MTNKHAYLIMAHNEFGILEKLMRLLDDERNDLYVHIDKKAKNVNLDYLKNIVKRSNVCFIPRMDTRWGHHSLVLCELELLKAALKEKYQYYHLLSGVDLPLKTNDQIHSFFDMYDGCEFVHFQAPKANEYIWGRVNHYHAMRYFQTGNRYISFLGRKMDAFLETLQFKLGFIRRWDENVELQYGAQWFSITHGMAKYFVDREKWIRKFFLYTSVSDEMVMQTVLFNSPFRENLYHKAYNGDYNACIRYIDWQRGEPYIFRREDFDDLINSNFMFARKFSTKVDGKVVDMIFEYLNQKK